MENIIAWLNTPLTEDGSFRLWMLVAACALAVIILLAFLNRKHRQKKTKRIERKTASVTEKPKVKPNLEIANLQGLGKREEQQDAFGASPVSYTHLDVYKRQSPPCAKSSAPRWVMIPSATASARAI